MPLRPALPAVSVLLSLLALLPAPASAAAATPGLPEASLRVDPLTLRSPVGLLPLLQLGPDRVADDRAASTAGLSLAPTEHSFAGRAEADCWRSVYGPSVLAARAEPAPLGDLDALPEPGRRRTALPSAAVEDSLISRLVLDGGLAASRR